jgi:hypothetical protein
MNKYLTSLALAGVFLMNACQTPPVSTAAPDLSNPPAASLAPATALNEQPLTPPAEPATTTGVGVAELSVADLSNKLKISADQIKVVKITPVVWRDASLGCPKPGIDYIQVETPGYRISLETGGKVYDYHTDEVKRVTLCDTLKP